MDWPAVKPPWLVAAADPNFSPGLSLSCKKDVVFNYFIDIMAERGVFFAQLSSYKLTIEGQQC